MMMKRNLSVLVLVMAALMALAAGCSKKEGAAGGSAQTVNLRFWTHQNIPWNDSNDRLAAGFMQENPGIKIEIEAFPYADFEQKTQTALASKTGGADIFELWGGWILDFAPTGALSPAPDALINVIKNDSYDPVLAGVYHDGKYYGVPIEFNQEGAGLLILKPWFEEHGIAYPKTWDEMIDIARKHRIYNNGTFELKGWNFISNDTLLFTYTAMIVSKGGNFLEDGGHRFNFDTPIGKEALQTLVDYVVKDHLTDISTFLGSGFDNEYEVFNGTGLMSPRGFWTIPTGKEMYGSEYGIDFDYIALPFYGPEKKWVAETGWSQAVNSGTQHPEESWKFVEYCHRTENLIQMAIDRGMIPPQKSAATSTAYLNALPYVKPIVDVLDGAQHIGYINTDVMKVALVNVFVDMVQSGLNVDAAVKRLNDELNAAVK
jgi:multiple sugar transport system substrate-binding protein